MTVFNQLFPMGVLSELTVPHDKEILPCSPSRAHTSDSSVLIPISASMSATLSKIL